MAGYLYEGAEWDFETVARVHDAIEVIARGDLGLEPWPRQIEVITAEQMLDAYAAIGMPQMYKHWSFGKHFLRDETLYRAGRRGLAYEIVINASPCIAYIMEENTMTMQTLVIAHAAFGHNHFFRNNQLFRQWTDAEGILGYIAFAKAYVADCEERYGQAAVERVLDAAHALMDHSVHRTPRRRTDLVLERRREQERRAYQESIYNDLWRTIPGKDKQHVPQRSADERRRLLGLPEENILYFFEKRAPRLLSWQREVLRIVRHIAQYFYPQKQTKVMNEGCATFCHYYIMNRLYEQGGITDGALLEFLQSHTSVVYQPDFDDPRYSGLNPYTLGFSMMQDIRRICEEPTEEDRAWFPAIAGCGDAFAVLRSAWSDYRDESFILQFLSPHLIRRLRLFAIRDDAQDPYLQVRLIHNERGYRDIRRLLARQYDLARLEPDIQVADVDLDGDRTLSLVHTATDGVLLDSGEARSVLTHIANLWGYAVVLRERDSGSGVTVREFTARPTINLFEDNG